MGFFTAREHTQECSQETQLRVQSTTQPIVRNSVPDDFCRRRRSADNDLGGHVGLERMGATALCEIDNLIGELRRRRDKLLNESARLQSAIVEYAKSSQSTLESTKIVTESLAFLHKAPNVPKRRAPDTESISYGQDREYVSEGYAEYGGGQEAALSLAEDKEVPGNLTSEPS
jgi:hypothetical protein